jgi:expansin (peptidoglycan-binding protein)
MSGTRRLDARARVLASVMLDSRRLFGLACATALASVVLACVTEDASDTSEGSDQADATTGDPDIQPCDDAGMHTGEATYYDFADGSGNCSFPATPDDLMVAAMNAVDYAGSAACGACVHIDGPDGSVEVRVVDQCPECPQGDIDLSPEAFAMIAALEQGRVPIDWAYVPCPVEGPIVYHFKDGSNPWWTAVQIRNHRQAIASFEVFEGDAWVEVPRVDYNYFVKDSGMGEGPLSFRVTDVVGNSLEDSGIPLLDDADVSGQGQLPTCGG